MSTASDDNVMIYTFVTSGTDQLIKLWRLYTLRDLKEPKGSSRLIPDEQTVCEYLNSILQNLVPSASKIKCHIGFVGNFLVLFVLAYI